MSIYGQLDQADQSCIAVADTLQNKLQSGLERMRYEDIQRAKKYLRSIIVSCKSAQETLKEFELLTKEYHEKNTKR